MNARTYGDALDRFVVTVRSRSKRVVAGLVADCHESITVGSPRTGAPGQPVDTSFLRNSWQHEIDPDGYGGRVFTNAVYAPVIEEGMMLARRGQVTGRTGQRLTLRSAVGGFHSVKLTIAGADNLLADVVARVKASGR